MKIFLKFLYIVIIWWVLLRWIDYFYKISKKYDNFIIPAFTNFFSTNKTLVSKNRPIWVVIVNKKNIKYLPLLLIQAKYVIMDYRLKKLFNKYNSLYKKKNKILFANFTEDFNLDRYGIISSLTYDISKNYLNKWYRFYLLTSTSSNQYLLLKSSNYLLVNTNYKWLNRKIPLWENKILYTNLINKKDFNYLILASYRNLNKKILFVFLDTLTAKSYLDSYLAYEYNFFIKVISYRFLFYFFVVLWLLSIYLIVTDRFLLNLVLDIFVIVISWVVVYFFYLIFGIVFPLFFLIAILLSKMVLDLIFYIFSLVLNKDQLSALFTSYVWKRVLIKKSNSISRIAEKKNIFVLFSDLQNFTGLSENLSPEEITSILNLYFKYLWKIVEKYGWYIDKYIWDWMMVFWENLIYSDDILSMVLEMKNIHKEFNWKINEKFALDVNLLTRFWINFWKAWVWEIGYNKINYTAFWDIVNTAARLESINKVYGTTILFSEFVEERIKRKSKFTYRIIDKVTLKWKNNPLKIYELINYSTNFDSEYLLYIRKFEKWVRYYISGDFDKAYEIFKHLLKFDIKYAQKDSVLKVILKRIEFLKQTPQKWYWYWRYDIK